jgi:hypothetical protein
MIVIFGPVPAATAAAPEPSLRFVAAAGAVTIERFEGDPISLDAGTHVVAGKDPFEVRAKRAAYTEPIVARQIVRRDGKPREVRLPAGLLTDFTGFPAFTHVTLTDAAGSTVVDRDETFCPNGDAVRTRPDAPGTSPYPNQCASFMPFALGSVWGIQAGWSTPIAPPPWRNPQPVDIEDGMYTAVVSINQPYRDLFGFSAGEWSATVQMTVRSVPRPVGPGVRLEPGGPRAAARSAPGVPLQPAAQPPTGRSSVPSGPKPDLRSLPAFAIDVVHQPEPGVRQVGDHVVFAATVWVAGNSPLVVDGFRRSDEDVMDAYQYFYDANGTQVGYSPVGTMEWDARDGHHHWHFTDFAQYRLLDADNQLAVRSGKEAFCLANTDPIDYTLPHANWRPLNTDLHSACGNGSSIAVREVLDVGNGDTYYQYLPGQSFDVTDLPNGTYYIEIVANPDRKLHEQNTNNNVSHRRIILGGTPGARTVEVPPHGLVDG